MMLLKEQAPEAGIERIIAMFGGRQTTWADFTGGTVATSMLKAGWIVGGYLSNWLSQIPAPIARTFTVLQDVLPSALSDRADVVLPSAMWAEKDGTWENAAGKLQTFDRAVEPPGLARREGDVYLRLLGREPNYVASEIREAMGDAFAALTPPVIVEEPAMEFAEL